MLLVASHLSQGDLESHQRLGSFAAGHPEPTLRLERRRDRTRRQELNDLNEAERLQRWVYEERQNGAGPRPCGDVPWASNSFLLLLVRPPVTTSKALVTSSDALVSNSFLLLLCGDVTLAFADAGGSPGKKTWGHCGPASTTAGVGFATG